MKISKEELTRRQKELEKCKEDVVYFAETYFNLNQFGMSKKLKTNDFQISLLLSMQNNFKLAVLAKRSKRKTTACLCYCAWKSLFFPNKQIVLIEPNRRSRENCFEILKMAFERMPDWMKPKIKSTKRTTLFCIKNFSSIHIETYSSTNYLNMAPATDLILDECNFSNNWLDKHSYIRYFSNVFIISSINPHSKTHANRIATISRSLSKGKRDWVVIKIPQNGKIIP